MNNYFELHNHSYFSYLDGVSRPIDMAKRAKLLGYPALALTDHAEIAGWYEFYQACKNNDIVPILGVEFYIAEDIEDKEENPFKKGVFRTKRGHLIVHAKGQAGVDAIRELYNGSWENFLDQGKKQIIFEHDLIKHAGNILVQSACMNSYIDSEEKAIRFKETFGDDFYLEIQPHTIDHEYDMEAKQYFKCEVDKQYLHNKKLIEWSRKHDVNLIVAGDAHYPVQEDKILQDILILNSFVGQKTGWHFYQDTNFLMDKDTWWELFEKLNIEEFTKDDFENSITLMHGMIEKCKDVTLEKEPSLRKFEIESHDLYKSGDTADNLIGRIIKDVGRYNSDQEYKDRLQYELKIIKDKGFLDYFLIQEDMIRWNKKNNYLVGPARGSAAGCLLAYYMDITKIDPIKNELLFERFLDVSRNDFPDIDVDYEAKEETVEYISNKYGSENVMAVGAYQTIKVKTAIKQAYKVLYKDKGYDYQTVNLVTGQIPESNARGEGDQLTIFRDLLSESKKEFDLCRTNQTSVPAHNLWMFMQDKKDLIKCVGKLIGKVTTLRVHPCSIVISDKPVKDVLPITTVKSGTKSEKWITAFDGTAVEASGYLKFDILGLKTLNCISSCLREIRKYKGNIIDGIDISQSNEIWNLPITDPIVYERMSLGDTDTVFQFNTDPLKRLLRDMVAGNFNDLVASAALIRPGPLKAGFPQLYVDRKFQKLELHEMYKYKEVKGKKRKVKIDVPYNHPLMDEILKDTYNVITYQEQVQKLFVAIGGFTPIESNSIRKAISKGKKKLILDSKAQFMKYATTKLQPVWTSKQVDLFYEDMIGFGSYCFNKSHSVAYAYLGYVCQYLKTHYPLEWWSGNLEHAGEKGTETILKSIRDGDLAPLRTVDINESKADFYFNGKEIVMPLKYISGVGENGLKYIIEEQAKEPFKNLKDFVSRVPGRSVRKNSVIGLIVAKAFDSIEKDRTTQELLKHYLLEIKKIKPEKLEPDLQELMDDESALERKRCQVDPFYHSDWVERNKHLFDNRIIPINKLGDYEDGAFVMIGGEKIDVRYLKVKRGKNAGQKMAFLSIQQLNSKTRVTLWPNMVSKYQELLDNKSVGLIEVCGKINRYNNELGIQATRLKEIKIG